jgi:hypothetical protein
MTDVALTVSTLADSLRQNYSFPSLPFGFADYATSQAGRQMKDVVTSELREEIPH